MLTTDDWQKIVSAAIRRTRELELSWEETEPQLPNTLQFEASVDADTSLSIWGYKTNYSYELSLVKSAGEEVHFEDKRRVTTKKNADGIQFAELFRVIQEQLKEASERKLRENTTAAWKLVMEHLSASPSSKPVEEEEALADRLMELTPFGDLGAAECVAIIDELLRMTEQGALIWRGSYEASIGENLVLSFSHDSEEPIFYLSVDSEDDGKYGFATLLEMSDYGLYPWHAAYRSAQALLEAIRRPIVEQDAAFKRIVKDDIVHGVLVALGAGAETVAKDTAQN